MLITKHTAEQTSLQVNKNTFYKYTVQSETPCNSWTPNTYMNEASCKERVTRPDQIPDQTGMVYRSFTTRCHHWVLHVTQPTELTDKSVCVATANQH